MTPIQAFELAIQSAVMMHFAHRHMPGSSIREMPGTTIGRLPQEAREALRQLTSDDIRTHGIRYMSESG